MQKLLESRIEIRPLLLTPHRLAKELLFLDLALASSVRTTMERGLKNFNFKYPPVNVYLIALSEYICKPANLEHEDNPFILVCLTCESGNHVLHFLGA